MKCPSGRFSQAAYTTRYRVETDGTYYSTWAVSLKHDGYVDGAVATAVSTWFLVFLSHSSILRSIGFSPQINYLARPWYDSPLSFFF